MSTAIGKQTRRGGARVFAAGLLLALALLPTGPAHAYEVLLDLDDDDDPTTLTTYTEETTATVRVILWPTEPGEIVETIEFGLGGSCRECEGVHQYGVGHDLVGGSTGDPWSNHPDFESWWDGVLLLDCPADPGFHLILSARPSAGSMALEAPIFLATFQAWKIGPPAGCSRTPANLATMFAQGIDGLWNYVQIGGPAIETSRPSWGTLKGLYR